MANLTRWVLAIALFCYAAVLEARAASIEPSIIPSVNSTLTPTSAIQVPLRFAADQTSVWRADQEQRMLLSGRVSIQVGYRTLKADHAAVWLTPSRESGENVFDVAIYLADNVVVREGGAANSTMTMGKELLVTTRVSQSVQLNSLPNSKSEEDSPIVKRGAELRQQLLARPTTPVFIPRITVTSAEDALQNGWIARGPNNRIIPGPGDIELVKDENGNMVPTTRPSPAQPKRPAPSLLAVGDNQRLEPADKDGKEMVMIMPGAYVLYDAHDGKPPIEFRAQRMVVFMPTPEEPATSTAPATTKAAATQPAKKDISQYVTGIYFEGDVTLDQGDQIMVRAERVYYDFTSQRAIMLDATLSAVDEKREIPVYMRASEIRQLARGSFAARSVSFSTSEFHTPHYHIGASEAYLRDITPQLEAPEGDNAGGGAIDLGIGGRSFEKSTYQFELKEATINVLGTPIFYWPFLAGDTSKNDIPLRTIRVSNSKTYGLSLLTDWDLFSLAGQPEPQGVRADLNLDYFGKRGPAGGVQSQWNTDDDHGILRTYALLDQGTDNLGRDRQDVLPDQEGRGRATIRDQRDLGDGLTLQIEASYISDPTFLEQFFQREFDSDKENETSIYLKKQDATSALTFLGKFNLMDFTATADQVDDQYTVEKKPEVKYWRIGDSFLDLFTYYSESSLDNMSANVTDFTPDQLGLKPTFLGPPASVVAHDQSYRDYLKAHGFITDDVIRATSRQELDMPLQIGDAKITPYIAGSLTYWDTDFPDPTNMGAASGSTTRLWGGGGIRASMQFWHVYDDVQSTFFDIHKLRHVIEPQFNLFAGGANVNRGELQLFDRDVEGISTGSGMQLSLNQKWQTKRGAPGHERDVDWLVFNISWNQFWDKDKSTLMFPQPATRGFFFPSRPELSLAQNSIDVDTVWRMGERARFLGEANYSLDSHNIEQAAAGIAIDQTSTLSYFFGNRYVRALNSDEWTFAMDYQLTQKYELIAAESYDFKAGNNILSSLTIVRKLPRFNTAITITYDANNADTSVVFTAWPEGFPNMGFGNQTGSSIDRR